MAESFPSRERGLKHAREHTLTNGKEVVPLAGTWIETFLRRRELEEDSVVPLAGTWIETTQLRPKRRTPSVVPLAGTWIETPCISSTTFTSPKSFPSRERGLKHCLLQRHLPVLIVVPLAGTWIETVKPEERCRLVPVVPLAGTWIETVQIARSNWRPEVVPLAGTWIETSLWFESFLFMYRRSPRGNVD